MESFSLLVLEANRPVIVFPQKSHSKSKVTDSDWDRKKERGLKNTNLPTGEIQESPKATPEKLHLMVPC